MKQMNFSKARIANFSKLVLVGLLISFISMQCGTTKKPLSEINSKPGISMVVEGCNAVATIRNFTHEADCQYLFRLQDGTLLLPGELPDTDVPFYENAGIKIGYEVLDKDESVIAKTICTSQDHIVRITCIEEYVIPRDGVPSSHEDCISIKNPYQFEWMRNAITKWKPSRLNEYAYTLGFIYEVVHAEGSTLYDCLGNEMCTTTGNQDCLSLLETLSSPKVILVVNN